MTTIEARRGRGKGIGREGLGLPSKLVALFERGAATDRSACLFLVLFCLIAFLPGFFNLPAVDRDEARFAQISRQMLTTGDLVEPRLGAEGRHTRPLGLHWLQAGIVGLAEVVGVPQASQDIALYRLPSLLAGIGAALLTFWAALAFVGRRAALFAGLLTASSAALGVLARLATPDALVVAAVAAMLGVVGRLSLAEGGAMAPPAARRLVAVFWAALGAALMVRGGVALVYVALPLAAIGLVDRRWAYLRPLVWWPGILACLALVALWTLLRFAPWPGGAERNLIGRVAPAFGGFGAPPGAYLVMFWGMFWPGAPLAALAVPILWKARRLRAVRLLFAFVLPVWLLFELLPNKLPVLVVPVFPAIAILISLAMERGALALANTRLARILWLWPLIGALIAVFALLALAAFDHTTSLAAWPLLLLGFFALVTAAGSVREYGVEKASLVAMAGMLVAGIGVMQLVLPAMKSIWVSPRLAEVAAAERCADPSKPLVLGAAGYNEPSLVFLAPGELRFMDGVGAAEFLAEGGCRAVFVEQRQEARFVRRAESLGLRIERGADVRGFDLNEARRVRLSLFRRAG